MNKLFFKAFLLLVLSCTLTLNVSAQKKLGKFGSSISKKVGPTTIRLPYSDVISYMDYAEPGNEDEIKKGKKFYYIYIWIPAVIPELGVRMLSPVGSNNVSGAIQTEAYLKNKDSKDYFDTYITIEKSLIFNSDNVTPEKVAATTWLTLKHNDDSREMPPLPNRKKYNSLFRYKSEIGEPLKALSVGLYRIGFTTYKTGEVKGTFLAEVASTVKLKDVVMARTLEELISKMNQE
ncbi:MAG: LipL32 family surface lipoprotein [Prolixibacteraceae bacterium]|jgi:hypothetical protein|nr:LipL32 family surface lipoprotein [Prolixibacteraceae bacterium]